jgi:DNA polymerase-3 subunit alpha
MEKKDFTHLHVHTEFSILDGVNKIKPLIERVKGLGMPACAITDHGVLHGVIDFYKECRKQEVKPIIGCEAYITDDRDDKEKGTRTRDNRHMILLCQNETGLHNLIWMINRANLHNFYYKPRICWDHLITRNEGLIATSACLAGVVAKPANPEKGIRGMVRNPEAQTYTDPQKEGRTRAFMLKEIFGDRFYLEIQAHDMWEQKAYNKWAIELAKKDDHQLVITSDAHYLREADKEVHELLMAQQLKMTREEYLAQDMMRYEGGKFWIREQDEMYREAAAMHAESAFWNTIEIMERCDLEITLGEYQTPHYDVTKAPDYEDFKLWRAQNSTTTSDTSA